MPFYYTPYIILPLLSFAVNGCLAIYAWRYRRVPAAIWLLLVLCGMSGWSLAYSLNTAATELWIKVLCYRFGTSFVCLILFAVLPLAMEATGLVRRLGRYWLLLPGIVPLVSLLMVWIPVQHTLMRYDFMNLQREGLLLLGFSSGGWYLIHLVYANLVNIGLMLLCLWGMVRSTEGGRARFVMIFLGTLVPVVVEVAGLTPVPGFSLTTSALLFSGICYTLAVLRYHLLELVPMARSALFELMHEPAMIFDLNGCLADANKAALTLLGEKQAKIGVESAVLFSAMPALDRMVTGRSPDVHDAAVWDSVSGRYWQPMLTEIEAGGIRRGRLLLLQDVTEAKAIELRMEEEIRSLRDQLEEEVARRVAHERIMAQHAKHAAMGEMIGAIAHQWRQPLSAVGVMVQNLRVAWDTGRLDKQFIEKTVDAAMGQVNYMSDTIDEFRNFFKPDKDKERFNVYEKLIESTSLINLQIACHRIGIEVGPCLEPLIVLGFPNEFKQVVLNLLTNARDAILERMESEPDLRGTITIRVCQFGSGMVKVEVEDNGCGIPANIAGRVYDPYFSTKPASEGTGVGLYMSRMIIEDSMEGRLSFKSLENGTVFVLELPMEAF